MLAFQGGVRILILLINHGLISVVVLAIFRVHSLRLNSFLLLKRVFPGAKCSSFGPDIVPFDASLQSELGTRTPRIFLGLRVASVLDPVVKLLVWLQRQSLAFLRIGNPVLDLRLRRNRLLLEIFFLENKMSLEVSTSGPFSVFVCGQVFLVLLHFWVELEFVSPLETHHRRYAQTLRVCVF